MRTVKAKITLHDDEQIEIPIVVPEIEEVRNFATALHLRGVAWKGNFSGWQAEYSPERSEKPLASKMEFTPADFCIGESGIWFYSLMWEHGKKKEPVEFVDESNLFALVDTEEMHI